MSARILMWFVVVRGQRLPPSSMPRRIKLCVNQSRPMKPAVTISKYKIQAVSRELKTTQRANEPPLNCWSLKACADATAPGCSGPCGFAGGSHRTSVDRPAVVLSQRCMVVDTPEQHLDDWNRCPRCRCGGGCFAALSRLAYASSQASPITWPWVCSVP